jgi:hypothetical protein
MVNKLNTYTGWHFFLIEVPQYRPISYCTMAFLLLALLETCLFCMEGVLQQDCGCLAHIFCISEKWDSPVFVLETAFHSKQGGLLCAVKSWQKQFHRDWGGYKEKSGELSRKLFQFIFSFMRMLMAIYMLAMQCMPVVYLLDFTRIFLNGKGLTLVFV